jgi:hypothetical protein
MAKRKVQPSSENGEDFPAANNDSTRKRARRTVRNATPSSSANPLGGRRLSEEPPQPVQGDRGATGDQATISGSESDDDEEEEEVEQAPVDVEALEETFRPQIEAERIANASRRGVRILHY